MSAIVIQMYTLFVYFQIRMCRDKNYISLQEECKKSYCYQLFCVLFYKLMKEFSCKPCVSYVNQIIMYK